MNHLFGDPRVSLHLKGLYKPIFSTPQASFVHLSFGDRAKKSQSESLSKCERSVRTETDFKNFAFQRRFHFQNKLVKVSETCKSLLKWIFDKLSCEKPVLTNFFNSTSYMRLIFHLDCEKLIFDRISRNTYLNRMGLVSL